MEQKGSDNFDRIIGMLHGLPGVTASRPTTIRTILPIIGSSQTFIIQTFRKREPDSEKEKSVPSEDFVFIEYVGAEGSMRFVLPPKAANAIARQRQAMTDSVRSQTAKRLAEERRDRGERPGFMKNKKGKP